MHKKTVLAALLLTAVTSITAEGKSYVSTWHTTENADSVHYETTSKAVTIYGVYKDLDRLKSQPLASSIFDSGMLSRLNLRDLRDISGYTPSFIMPDYGSRLTSSMYLRGIGSRVNSPSVAVYFDDMPLLGKAGLNFHAYRLAAVAVQRGAQGTLYGQNSEGGLVRMETRKPYDNSTELLLGAGNGGSVRSEFSFNRRNNSRFGWGFSGFYNHRDGFFTNSTTGEKADLTNEGGARLNLLWTPGIHFRLDWLTDAQFVEQQGFPYGLLNTETGLTADPANNLPNSYRRLMVNNRLRLSFRLKKLELTSVSSYQYLNDDMRMDQDYLAADFMHLRQRQLQQAVSQELVGNAQVTARWRQLTGVFGSYQWLKTDAPVFFDSEMNNMLSGTIQRSMYNAMVASFKGRFMQQGMPAAQAQAAAEAAIQKAGGVNVNVNLAPVPGIFRTPQLNLAAYHESNIKLSESLKATLGLRYDFTRVAIDYNTQAAMTTSVKVMGRAQSVTLQSLLDDNTHTTFNELLPKVGLTYSFGSKKQSNVYAAVSKGYRAGGYNIQMFSDILTSQLNAHSAQRADYVIPHTTEEYDRINRTIAYKPEVSWNYEVGTHTYFVNGMYVDLSAYYMTVANQQLSVMAGNYGFGRMMVNAGKSQSCGVELAVGGTHFDKRLTWGATYSFTRATFKNYTDSLRAEGKLVQVDYKGKYVPYVPQHTASVFMDYTFPFACPCLQSIVVGVNATGAGRIYWDEANTASQPFYTLVGAHADVNFAHTTVSLWGRNLTNTRFNTFAVQSGAAGTPLFFAQQGLPLQWGVDLKWRF